MGSTLQPQWKPLSSTRKENKNSVDKSVNVRVSKQYLIIVLTQNSVIAIKTSENWIVNVAFTDH